jgi:hypothetical protein
MDGNTIRDAVSSIKLVSAVDLTNNTILNMKGKPGTALSPNSGSAWGIYVGIATGSL